MWFRKYYSSPTCTSSLEGEKIFYPTSILHEPRGPSCLWRCQLPPSLSPSLHLRMARFLSSFLSLRKKLTLTKEPGLGVCVCGRGLKCYPDLALSNYPAPSYLCSLHSQLLLQVLPPGSLLSCSWVFLSAFLPGGATGQLKKLPSHREVESKCVSVSFPAQPQANCLLALETLRK